jgi:hypothetical protein
MSCAASTLRGETGLAVGDGGSGKTAKRISLLST